MPKKGNGPILQTKGIYHSSPKRIFSSKRVPLGFATKDIELHAVGMGNEEGIFLYCSLGIGQSHRDCLWINDSIKYHGEVRHTAVLRSSYLLIQVSPLCNISLSQMIGSQCKSPVICRFIVENTLSAISLIENIKVKGRGKILCMAEFNIALLLLFVGK